MPLIANLALQISFVLALIGMGFILGRRMPIDIRTVGGILIYAVSPVVTFGAILQIHFTPSYLLLPLLTFAGGGLISSLVFYLGRRGAAKNGDDASLLALTGSTANSGYFGLPVVVALFPPEWVGVYLMANMGITIAEATFGYYYLARGNFSVAESIRRVLRLPALYAVLAGVALSAGGVMLPDALMPMWQNFKGSFTVLGMALVGIGLAQHRFHIDPGFIARAFAIRHLLWAVYIFGFIALDHAWLGLFPPMVHALLALYPLLPLAANITAFAVDLKADVSKAAFTVLASQIFGAGLIMAAVATGLLDAARAF